MMDYTTLFPKSQEGQNQPVERMRSLYQVYQQVVDGRKARGKRSASSFVGIALCIYW
jgi:hypothetical protein